MGIFDKLFKTNKTVVITEVATEDCKELMGADQFWKIISVTQEKSFGNYERQQVELKKELLNLPARNILEFDNKFRTLRGDIYHWDFWAVAYIINGGCSDDCFSDFRGWLIGQGRTLFENAVQKTESLSELNHFNDGDWEGLSYVATDAYKQKTRKDIPFGILENMEISGEEWEENEEELIEKFPLLWNKFGNTK